MSKTISISILLRRLENEYLNSVRHEGGTRSGFVQYVITDLDQFRPFFQESIEQSAKKQWDRIARKEGPDLFCVAGTPLPETLTRVRYLENGDEQYQKVHQGYATVDDLYQDATFKLRKAAQSAAAAEKIMETADECRRRAQNVVSARLSDIVDKS